MIRVIIKGPQGSGKTTIADAIISTIRLQGKSFSLQDGGQTTVERPADQASGATRKSPVDIAIIVKQR